MKISTLPVVIFFKIYMYTYVFIFGCAGSLLLLGLFSSCRSRGYSVVAGTSLFAGHEVKGNGIKQRAYKYHVGLSPQHVEVP